MSITLKDYAVVMCVRELILCVDGLVFRNGKLLMFRRNLEPFRGFWHVIGGHVEEGRDARGSFERVFKEETGLDITVGELIRSCAEETAGRTKMILIFEVVCAEGKIKLNHENKEPLVFTEIPEKAVCNYRRYIDKKRNES